MRYAVVSAAVFGSALFLAPNSLLAGNSSQNLLQISNKQSSAQTAVKAKPDVNLQTTQATVASSKPTGSQATLAAAVDDVTVYVVAGDTLTKLAQDHQTTVQRLYDANASIANPDLIHVGQQLRVPSQNEQLVQRDMPTTVLPVGTASAQSPAAQPATVTMPSPSVPSYASAPAVASSSVWDRLAQCESGGNWSINTGNGFYGGVQFTIATWQGLGGTGLPSQASREEQIMRATALQARSGWGQWPACSAKLGLR